MELRVHPFENGGIIPDKYTCVGEDVSPEISWSGYPAGTRSFALIVEDPDAPIGIFTHWIIYNIALDISNLKENLEKKANLFGGLNQGKNDFGRIGYNGPCPPRGHGFHRYYFRLFALSTDERLKPGLDKEQFYSEIRKHIVGQTEYMGRFARD